MGLPVPDNTQHSFGALDFPVPIVDAKHAASDPALDYIGSYLMAVLNAYASDAWRAIAPTAQETPTGPVKAAVSPPVTKVFTNAPKEGFTAADLPALFMTRSMAEQDVTRIADDYLISFDIITATWVFPMARQDDARIRSNFLNAVSKIVAAALHNECDPAWKVPGDPDPLADRLGSSLQLWAGYWWMFPKRWTMRQIVMVGDDKPAPYIGLEIPIHIQERYVSPLGDGLEGSTLTLETTDAPPFVTNTIALTPP